MKNSLHLRSAMRSVLFGAAMATAACTFTACDQEGAEVSSPQQAVDAMSQNGALIDGQYIVVFNKNETLRMDASATYEQRVDAMRKSGREIFESNGIKDATIEQAYGKAINGVAAKLTASEVEVLRNDPRVAYVEQDRIVTLGKPGTGGGGTTAGQEVPWGITRVGGRVSGVGKTAWIIDTGINLTHPDLNVDASRSISMFTSGRDAGSAEDNNGHGSHVAGTIAALDNNIGVVGVAAGATVVAVKVLDSRGSGSYSGVIAGVDYVAANGSAGDVANMSLGGPVSQALDDAILAASKDVKFALAAGNESADANNSSPARVNGNNIYTVSAIDINDKFASFSNYGNPPVDFAAPGVSIKSTWKGGGYNTISGTSMASPHVAGLLLLGNIVSGGSAIGDPDGQPDTIAHH
ncbi:S8 family serine peptidase [Pontibacter sp. MBLB2868]|uniref:S8 family serine peptidase n=1 Tax=Pontibacter sp. MBLB2868 TaxID=3451555 RepID=UPI003F751743